LVSVVTPALDPGQRLVRCIENIRAQSYDNIEHVVVDGGSTDGTKEILEASDVRWISEPDSGQSEAINKGFGIAQGEILGWLNADDTLTPRAIELVVDAFREDAQLGWVYGDVVIDDDGCRTRERPARVDKPITWAARNVAAQPGSFHSRAALDLVGGLNENFHYMMDLELWLRMIDAGVKALYIPEVLAVFELHEGSKSGSVSHVEFLEEEARARFENGRLTTGAVAVGRAAAWRTSASSSPDLDRETDDLLDAPWVAQYAPPPDVVRAAARAESAILLSKSAPLAGVRSLFSFQLWKYKETRARLRDAARRELSRRVRGKCA
jgi:hypothetical protein